MVDLIRNPGNALISNPHPCFSWVVRDAAVNAFQTDFQIRVASSAEVLASGLGDFWDSKESVAQTEKENSGHDSAVHSERTAVLAVAGSLPSADCAVQTLTGSTQIAYRGAPLESDQVYFWQVRTWNQRGEVSPWSLVQAFRTGKLAACYATDVERLQVSRVEPAQIVSLGKGGCFVDFGKAAFATLELELEAVCAGSVQVHLGEVATAQGRINREPGGSRRYQVQTLVVEAGRKRYILAIPPDQRNTIDFAIHMPPDLFEVYPFRYCEVHAEEASVSLVNAVQLVVHHPFDEGASHFASSSSELNAIWELCKYSIKATSFCGYYVDGDRERIPYEADAYVNQLSHYCVDREYALARRTHEYLIHNPTWPTEWILCSVLIAWEDYLYSGNDRSLRHYYADLQAKTLDALADPRGLISLERLTESVLEKIHFTGRSREHYSHTLRDIVDWPPSERDSFEDKPVNAVVNAYHYGCIVRMGEIAEVLGHREDTQRYRAQAEQIRKSYTEVFFDSQAGLYRDGETSGHYSLHANMFALAFDLVPEGAQESVLRYVRSKGMACSVYGAQFLLDGLFIAGDADYALELLQSRGLRSWMNMIEKGSTITMEAWDDSFKPNQDWNHAWGAAPANVIPRRMMGIRPLAPGFAEIIVQPQTGNLAWAEVTMPTIRGTVHLRVENPVGGQYRLKLETPANTTTCVLVPSTGDHSDTLFVNGTRMQGMRVGRVIRIDGLKGGSYTITRA